MRSELDEKPRRSPKKILKTTSSSLRRKSALDSDEDGDDDL